MYSGVAAINHMLKKEISIMRENFFGWLTIMFFFGVVLSNHATPSMAGEFSADMIQGKQGKTTENKIYVKEDLYRIDATEDGQDIIIIVDQKKGITRVLVPDKKIFLEIENKNPRSMMNNPIQALRFTAERYSIQPVGSETVDGYDCEKKHVSGQGQDLVTSWESKKLGFPIKIINHLSNDMFVELKNIQEDSVQDNLLQTPEGFKKVEKMPEPIPDWTKDIASSPVKEPPFEVTLKTEEILRIKIVPGHSIKVHARNTSDMSGSYTSVAFKGGKPLTDPSKSTFGVPAKAGGPTTTHKQTPQEADQIVVRVKTGEFIIKAELVKVSDKASAKPPIKPAATQPVDAAAEVSPDSTAAKIQSTPSPIPATPAASSTVSTESTPAGSEPATGQTPSARVDTMLVLDASGSMWGQIKGKAKIQIAREVIGELLDDWDPNFKLGLTAYGHRRKGDCNDIETLIPVGQADPAAIKEKINQINPKGKTPLSEAVRRAAKELRYTKERAIVILISDGIETCDLDPCAVGAELAMNGIDFTTYVIGFDVKKEEQAGLRCLAENTGGIFLSAADAKGLRDALFKTVKKVKEPPPPLVEDPGEATLEAPAEVPAGSDFNVKWEGSNSRNDFITIVSKNAPDGSYTSYAYTLKGNPAELTAPDEVGPYEIRYVFGRNKATLARADITVIPVEASLEVPAEVGSGSEFTVTWKGPDNQGDYITIVNKNADNKKLSYAYTYNGSPAELTAPAEPGTYEVRYIMGQSKTVLASKDISVGKVGATVEAPLSVAAGSEFDVNWQGPDNSGDYITIVPVGAPAKKQLSYAYTYNGSPVSIKAPKEPGKYEVRYIMKQNMSVLDSKPITVQ